MRKVLTTAEKRQLYIPADYKVDQCIEALGVLVLVDPTGLRALGFAGRSGKPAFFYRFGSVERREAYVKNWLAGLEAREEAKRARRAAATVEASGLEVGTVLVSSWGYDQTNVEFYEVVRVVGKSTVELREIAQERREDDYMQGSCIPLPGVYVGAAFRRRVNAYGSVKVSSFQHAHRAEFQEVAGCKVYKAHRFTAYA